MKRYEELTHEELIALTDEQVQLYIDLEIAHAGILPVPEPTYFNLPEVEIEPTVEAYVVHDVILTDKEEAIALSKMKVKREDYDPSIGYEYKFLGNIFSSDEGLHVKKFYVREELQKIGNILKERNRLEKENESLKKEYGTYLQSVKSIVDNVWSTVREAHEYQYKLDRAKQVFEKHLALAENNREIATKFFRDAYKNEDEEFITKVIGE